MISKHHFNLNFTVSNTGFCFLSYTTSVPSLNVMAIIFHSFVHCLHSSIFPKLLLIRYSEVH